MMQVLAKENIKLNQTVKSKEEAIRLAGQTLIENGYVTDDYIAKMFEREETSSTFMGNFIAIPHGTEDAKERSFTQVSPSFTFRTEWSTVRATQPKWCSASPEK